MQTGLASAVFAGPGALGITKALVVLPLRVSLWSRAVAMKVSGVTLSVSSVWPPVPADRRLRIGVYQQAPEGSVVTRRRSAARS